jgi:hypothetical protein
VLWNYERAKKLGLDYDLRKEVYEKVGKMNFKDIREFQQKYFKDQPKAMLVMGSKKRIDMDTLKKYGEVKEVTLEEIFGY